MSRTLQLQTRSLLVKLSELNSFAISSMTTPEALPNPYLPAVIGLIGVAVGAAITKGADSLKRRQANWQDKVYLAVIVGADLDRFISGCWDVANDDGTYMGQPAGGDGTYEVTTKNPTFDPSSIDVNWKALGSDMLARIWELPRLMYDANGRVHQESEEASSPYDGSSLGVRAYEYAKLGLVAAKLSSQLRKSANLPGARAAFLQSLTQLEAKKTAYEERVKAWQEQYAEYFKSLPK